MKKFILLFSIVTLLGVTSSHGTVFFDTLGLTPQSSVRINSDYTYTPYWVAQHFTTDNSAELTIRRVSLVVTPTFFPISPSLSISIRQEIGGTIAQTSIGEMFAPISQAGTNLVFGNITLQPNTSYWAVIQLQGLTASFGLDIEAVAPTIDFGTWGKYPSDANCIVPAYSFINGDQSVQRLINLGNTAVRMEISSVPEPDSVCLLTSFGIILFARRVAMCKHSLGAI